MSEPELEDIGDYDTLKGSKKRGVWTVIVVGLLIGTIYVVVSNKYANVNDSLNIHDPIQKVKLAN